MPVRWASSAGVAAGGRHRVVQSELVADDHEAGVERGRDVLNGLAEELLHLLGIQGRLLWWQRSSFGRYARVMAVLLGGQ